MSEDKTITMEMITFVKYKDECYEVGEVIKSLLNKLDEKIDEIERLNKENEELKHKLKLINSYVYGCNIDSLGSDKDGK